MSSLLSASSISVLPISFFAYFSKHYSANSDIFVRQTLTYSALLYLLRGNPEKRQYFGHYLNNNIHHFVGRSCFCVDLDTSEKHFDSFENVDKSFLACSNIFSCLRDPYVTTTQAKSINIHTERRTPTPAKITLAGEKSYHINEKTGLKELQVMRHTRPAPAPRMPEKANRTLTVGSSHFVHLSSVLRD